MGYTHKNCRGEIRWFPPLPIPPRCKKCGKTWSPLVVYGLPPKDMVYIKPKPSIKRHEDYAKWGNKIPFVGEVAGMLPRWARWKRILSFVLTVGVLSFLAYWLLGR